MNMLQSVIFILLYAGHPGKMVSSILFLHVLLSPMAPPLSPMTPSLSSLAHLLSPMAASFSSMAPSIEDSPTDKPSDQFPESGSNEKLGETPAGVSILIAVDKTLKEWNGFKIVGDNLDLSIHPRNQHTKPNQILTLFPFICSPGQNKFVWFF